MLDSGQKRRGISSCLTTHRGTKRWLLRHLIPELRAHTDLIERLVGKDRAWFRLEARLSLRCSADQSLRQRAFRMRRGCCGRAGPHSCARSTTSLFYFAAVLCTAVDRSALRFVRLSCRNGVDWMGRRRPARGSAGTLICTHPLKDRPAIGGVLASIAYSTRFAPHRRSPRWRDRTTPPKATVEPRCHGCGPTRLATPVPWIWTLVGRLRAL